MYIPPIVLWLLWLMYCNSQDKPTPIYESRYKDLGEE